MMQNRIALTMVGAAFGIALAGCSTVGDYTVKPVVNKALANSKKTQMDLQRDAASRRLPQISQPISFDKMQKMAQPGAGGQ